MKEFYFAEQHSGPSFVNYLFIDEAFIGSVFCETDGQNTKVEFWVSAARSKHSPLMVLRASTSLKCEKAKLDSKVERLWKGALKLVAARSRKSRGIQISTSQFKELDSSVREALIGSHLFAHDRAGNFNTLGHSKVAKTASMYLFLQSMGTKQAQKAIAEYEDRELLGEVKTTAINQRLAIAKQSGLL